MKINDPKSEMTGVRRKIVNRQNPDYGYTPLIQNHSPSDYITISVVIPVCNEENILTELFTTLEQLPIDEVIMVDCGSRDATWHLLQKWSKHQASRFRRIISKTSRGRGKQMNAGAKLAAGDILLFLHADTSLPMNGLKLMRTTMRQANIVGGVFCLKINSSHFFLKFISWIANLRSLYMRLPYGDQGYFVRRDLFTQMGGYREIALMEDLEFFSRLKKEGEIAFLKEAISTSARRWQRQGYYFASVRNLVLLCLYALGVSPDKLARWYYT